MLQSRQQIGKLDRQITFLQRIISKGESNEDKIEGWEEIESNPTVSASKRDLSGTEVPIADRMTQAQPTKFTIRWRSDLVAKDSTQLRLVCEGRVYDIKSIAEDNESRRRFLNVMTDIIDNIIWT